MNRNASAGFEDIFDPDNHHMAAGMADYGDHFANNCRPREKESSSSDRWSFSLPKLLIVLAILGIFTVTSIAPFAFAIIVTLFT